jgi:hypothetical protein
MPSRPDAGRHAPTASLEEIADQRLIWASFALLNQAIDELLADTSEDMAPG